ncbi:MAG TPA: DUF4011 domain-containing protein [Pseudonocardia sp.]|nr:DUF4011 domain-containing protein [Pseudonocardia sp.]
MSPDQPAALSITLEARPVLSYAMAHNEIPVISRLEVGPPERDLRGAVLVLEVADASGSVGRSQSITFDAEAGQPTVFTDLTLRLDPAQMLQVEEQRPATVHARVEVEGVVRAEQATDVRLLAAHQWLRQPPTLAMEMLAAHVMPNHPAVAHLLREAADRLQASTGSPSLEGYQSGPERVDAIVEAIYLAMQARDIGYAEPPASWGDVGQKVRTPGEVLDERVGTCLDTVVVMAAALEQSGIRPLLWVVEGHAFLGYWREETSLAGVVELDPTGVVNRVELNQVGLVETTAVTRSSEPVPFAVARRLPRDSHLSGDLRNVFGIVDVYQARRDRILPLPARTRDAAGEVHVSVYQAAASSDSVPLASPSRTAGTQSTSAAPARVTRWKNALLDLSLRNRLVNYSSRSGLQLTVSADELGALEDLLHQGSAISLRATDEIGAVEKERGIKSARDLPQTYLADLLRTKRTIHVDVSTAAYPTKLRSLAYKARTITEETGANNLYLSLGMLVWQIGGKEVRSPLILVPVILKAAGRGGTRYQLTLDDAGASTPNYCLIEKLRQTHGLDIPGLTDPVMDSAGIDLDAAFDATRGAVADLGFRVEPSVDLAVLQFAKFRLWKDLDDNWAEFARNPLVKHLIDTPTEAFADHTAMPASVDFDELDERCPVPADSSQLHAVADAVGGQTFVLEGPPGTGKSQTITNLLTHAVAEGKRVLFIAEKRAALDVVQKRLAAVGMGPLCLDLHDKGSKPALVREQIARALDLTVVADVQDHEVKSEELKAARRSLSRYVFRLHERNRAGQSLYEAHNVTLGYGSDVTPLPVPEDLIGGLEMTSLEGLRRLFSTLPDTVDLARPTPNHPWVFIDARSTVNVEKAHEAARRIQAVLSELPTELEPALSAVRVPGDLDNLATAIEGRVPLQLLDEVRSAPWVGATTAIVAEINQFAATQHPGLETVTPAVLTLPIAEIDEAAREAAASGFFGRKKRLIAVADQLSPVLRPEVTIPPKTLTQLTAALVALRNAVDELGGRVDAIPGLSLAAGWTPFDAEHRAEIERQINRLSSLTRLVDPASSDADVARFAGPLREGLAAGAAADTKAVRELSGAMIDLALGCATPPGVLGAWGRENGFLARWRSTAAERAVSDPQLSSLRRWLDLIDHVEPLRVAGLTEVRSMILEGRLNPDDARRSFDLGLAQVSVEERLRNTGLAGFDAAAHERSIARFGAASLAVRDHLSTVLPQRVLNARGFNPAAAGGQVGLLRRQLTMKRGGKKVRELMSEYGDLITKVLPCVLVSPDSLARFFPATAGLFDIVVFDESSQVRVADAIGAMGRGRSTVIVGDSKQMPPTSFAESAFSGDDVDADAAGETVEDEESILTECVQARVERHRLTWHYRSRDESLIAFSNQHYYDGALSSFPAPVHGAAVSLVRVNGQYHRSGPRTILRTNPIEAEAIVAEVRSRFDASPDPLPSIGIVTFNQQQRGLVEGLLRDTEDPRILEALDDAEGLFVKNLENVQGDERDVILFSTAFSTNERGVLPLNFGPLTRLGGERRLNVAVTRARRQVIVFSSFDPSDLRTEDTASVGIKHLRTYLEMAAHGPSAIPRDQRARALPDRHREQIASVLRERGLAVRTNVGLSDFTLDLVLADAEAPDEPLVAVLLDGPAWQARPTARDRDALPHEVLVGMLGWPAVERVWLPEWLSASDAVCERLIESVAKAAEDKAFAAIEPESIAEPHIEPEVASEEPLDHPVPAEPKAGSWPSEYLRTAPERTERTWTVVDNRSSAPESPAPTPVPDVAAAAPAAGGGYEQLYGTKSNTVQHAPPTTNTSWTADAEVFVPWPGGHFGSVDTLDALPSPAAAHRVTAALAAVINAEGPIHTDRLARIVGNGFELGRVVGARRTAILRHGPDGAVRDRNEPVIWPKSINPDTWTGYRTTPDGVDRPLEHIALREIGNAMVATARASAGSDRDDLYREVLALFGFKRRTAGIVARLDSALHLAERTHRLTIQPSGLIVADN